MSLLYPREMLTQLIEERSLELEPGARDTLFMLADTVFFASLRREEGDPIQVAVVHVEGGAPALARVVDSTLTDWGENGPPPAWDVTEIAQCPFDARTLAKLSRGLEYGTHLVVVGGRAPDLWVDGIARRTPDTDGGPVTRIAAPRPGSLVFEERNREVLRFDAGQRVPPTIDLLSSDGPVRAAVAAITGKKGPAASYSRQEWALMLLLRHMRTTGEGAILAILPEAPDDEELAKIRFRRADALVLARRIEAEKDKWMAWLRASTATMVKTTLSAEEVTDVAAKRAERDSAREALDAAIEDIARLSAIDGAVLAGPGLAIYGAGYIIPSKSAVEVVQATDAEMESIEPLSPRYHGARHQAAFSFAHDNPGGVAFVVSEDGPVSCALKVKDGVVAWPVHLSET